MPVNQFFEKKGPFSLKEIIKNISCTGNFSHANDFEIYGVESLSNATRYTKDWVLDVIIQPLHKTKLCSIIDVLEISSLKQIMNL